MTQAPAIVSREELGEHIWGAGVHVDLDQSLNFCIRQIRQVLGDSATEPRYVETLPRQGYRFIGRIEESPQPAASSPSAGSSLLAHGSDEKTLHSPEASYNPTSTTHDVEQTDPVNATFWRFGNVRHSTIWFSLLGIALIVTVFGAAWRDHLFRHPAAFSPVRSIAVLPLDNLSGDPGQNYLADGMTDELTTMLAKDSTLRVISRTSVMQYKGVHRPIRLIARELGSMAFSRGPLRMQAIRCT